MSQALIKQHQKILRELMRNPCNKKCADCGEQCAVNVDVTHGIFLCASCAGIHREFSDRIKSVNMATFAQDEIALLQHQTNDDFNRVWMSKWSPNEFPLPTNADDNTRRCFLQAKYVEKRWFSKRAAQQQNSQGQPNPPSQYNQGGQFNSQPQPNFQPQNPYNHHNTINRRHKPTHFHRIHNNHHKTTHFHRIHNRYNNHNKTTHFHRIHNKTTHFHRIHNCHNNHHKTTHFHRIHNRHKTTHFHNNLHSRISRHHKTISLI